MTPEERKENWHPATPWWFAPTSNVLDRATATVPKILNERMDELGMDYAVLYTTLGLGFDRIQGFEQRLIVCRAMNACAADLYRPLFAPHDARGGDTDGYAGDCHPGDGVRCKRSRAEDDNAAGAA